MGTGTRWSLPATISLVVLLVLGNRAHAATCESLKGLRLEHATVTSAVAIAIGKFTPPGGGYSLPGMSQAFKGLPPFCRVHVQSTPTADSLINIEVWIPSGKAWNGKYEQLGCGGFCGTLSFSYASLARAVRRGYASAATDDGAQDGGAGRFALGHPKKIIDFGYRALKETTDTAKAIIARLEGEGPQRSYFNGCSDGGREALMEAQRFPDDFDGIIVGAPANSWTHIFTGFVTSEQALLDDPASYIPPAKLRILSTAAIARCTRHDGNAPGDKFINDPPVCKFDPVVVACKAGQEPSTCLTPAQVKAARSIYDGPHDPSTGKPIAAGFEPGNEDDPGNWPVWIIGVSRRADIAGGMAAPALPLIPQVALQEFYGNTFFANFVFQSPSFDFRTFDAVTAVAAADNGVGKVINATSPDLRPFMQHGGKMIQYAGWDDSALPPMNSVNYYNEVRTFLGEKAGRGPNIRGYTKIQSFYRLFMVPGMGHCGGGPGASEFGGYIDPPVVDAEHDVLTALDRWVENRIAPEKIIATHYVDNDPGKGVQFQRPLCPYPQVAHYKGHGDPSAASSFTCH